MEHVGTFGVTELYEKISVKNFTNNFFGMLGLRYEHTDVKGMQQIDNLHHDKSYGYLFPTLNLSWNKPKLEQTKCRTIINVIFHGHYPS